MKDLTNENIPSILSGFVFKVETSSHRLDDEPPLDGGWGDLLFKHDNDWLIRLETLDDLGRLVDSVRNPVIVHWAPSLKDGNGHIEIYDSYRE